MNTLARALDVVNPILCDDASLVLDEAAEDAAYLAWLDAHADELAGESEALDRLTAGLLA